MSQSIDQNTNGIHTDSSREAVGAIKQIIEENEMPKKKLKPIATNGELAEINKKIEIYYKKQINKNQTNLFEAAKS